MWSCRTAKAQNHVDQTPTLYHTRLLPNIGVARNQLKVQPILSVLTRILCPKSIF